MPQLSLGTIDSFFHRMLGLFPFEFGLSGEFEIMNDLEIKRARSNVLEWMFDSRQVDRSARAAMIESHRLASAGKDKRDFVLAFARHLDDCHELFMRESSGKYWGDPFRIWPEGNPWIKQRDELFKMVEVLESELELQDNFTKQIYNGLKCIKNTSNIIIAYEPVWSIGTGLIPKANDLLNSISFIKSKFRKKTPKVLYGGSVNSKNITQLKDISIIDGFLIGGASQNSKKFIDIIKKTFN